MGFGILFLGYFLALPAISGFYYTMVPAAILFAIACRKLARVNSPFWCGFCFTPPLFLAATAASVLRTIPATVWLAPYFETLTLLLWFLWHIFVLKGIAWVAEETGLKKLRFKAVRNTVFTYLIFIPAILLTFMGVFARILPSVPFITGMYIAIIVVGFILLLLNLLLIYSAYARICMPEDRDMPQKPSRFEFINRRRAEQDRREAENAAALEEAKLRRRQRLQEKNKHHTKNRHHNKKRK